MLPLTYIPDKNNNYIYINILHEIKITWNYGHTLCWKDINTYICRPKVILNSSHDLQGKGLLNLCIYECTIILQLTEYISQMSHVYKVSRTHGIAKGQLNNSQQKHYVITQFYYNVDNTCMINSRSSPFPCIRGGHW